MALILILADSKKSGRLSSLLKGQGYQVVVAADWEDGLAQLEEQEVELLLISLESASVDFVGQPEATGVRGGPKGEGAPLKEGLRRLRAVKDIPVVAITPEEKLAEGDWLWGFNDFILEPYRPAELLARLRHLLGPGSGESQNLIVVGDLVIDGDKYQVYIGSRLVPLTFKEFELLKFLASRPGKVFSRGTLLNQVWGYDYFGGERTVDVHIRRLRSKIEDRTYSFIDTVRNVGYRFKG